MYLLGCETKEISCGRPWASSFTLATGRVCNSRNNSESLHLEGWSKTEMRSCMKSLRTAPNAFSVTGKP